MKRVSNNLSGKFLTFGTQLEFEMKKSVIVTGGGTGIGLATATLLTEQGYNVHAIGLEKADSLPENVSFTQVDVTDVVAVDSIVSTTTNISALVNCAGILLHEKEWEEDQFSKVLAVNLTACLTASKAVLPHLERNQGSIVNTASMMSLFGAPGSPGYGASKAGIVSLTRSLAVAWGPKGVRVNAVAPGWIDTRLTARVQNDVDREPYITPRIPMRRWGQPEDIASVISFLISPAAAYINGVMLPVDGGYSVT